MALMGGLELPPALRLGEARAAFLKASGLPEDGGYSARFFWLGFGPLKVPIPNLPARVRAVRLHDLHHVLAGYDTSWTGEAEIAGWELASGCRRYWAAWLLNFGAFAIGLVIAPRRLWSAFVRGRRSRNLYDRATDDGLTELPLGEVREDLGLAAREPDAGAADGFLFVLCGLAALAVNLLPGALGLAGLVWLMLR
jgi:hypothetical protein